MAFFTFKRVKLKEMSATPIQESQNPVLHILTPLLDYHENDRLQWTIHAYQKLSRLTDLKRFYKYMDYIDKYANIKENEKQKVIDAIVQSEDTIMIREALME